MNIFATQPVGRLTPCMVGNKFFRGPANESTPFQDKIFRLSKIEIQRGKGVPFAGAPIDTMKNTRLFYNTVCALGFKREGIGIKMTHFEANHYLFVFVLTSSKEARKALTIFPELTSTGITMKLSFAGALSHTGEFFCRWTLQLNLY